MFQSIYMSKQHIYRYAPGLRDVIFKKIYLMVCLQSTYNIILSIIYYSYYIYNCVYAYNI